MAMNKKILLLKAPKFGNLRPFVSCKFPLRVPPPPPPFPLYPSPFMLCLQLETLKNLIFDVDLHIRYKCEKSFDLSRFWHWIALRICCFCEFKHDVRLFPRPTSITSQHGWQHKLQLCKSQHPAKVFGFLCGRYVDLSPPISRWL